MDQALSARISTRIYEDQLGKRLEAHATHVQSLNQQPARQEGVSEEGKATSPSSIAATTSTVSPAATTARSPEGPAARPGATSPSRMEVPAQTGAGTASKPVPHGYPAGAYLTFPEYSFTGSRPFKSEPENGVLFERQDVSSSVHQLYIRPDRAALLAQQHLQHLQQKSAELTKRIPTTTTETHQHPIEHEGPMHSPPSLEGEATSLSLPEGPAEAHQPALMMAATSHAGNVLPPKTLPNGVPLGCLDHLRERRMQGRQRMRDSARKVLFVYTQYIHQFVYIVEALGVLGIVHD